jgi:hypothetical protein
MLLVSVRFYFRGSSGQRHPMSAVTVFPLQFYSFSYSFKCVCIFTFMAHRNLYGYVLFQGIQ